MIAFARENPADVLHEIRPLLEMHWREIAHFQDIALDPNWDFYLRAPLHLYTARDDGELVGYAVFVVASNKHYQTSIQAVQDIFFLRPDNRVGRTGYRFIKYCDEQLSVAGVQVVYHHTKAAHSFGPLLEHLGYEAVDIIYAKRLDKSWVQQQR